MTPSQLYSVILEKNVIFKKIQNILIILKNVAFKN